MRVQLLGDDFMANRIQDSSNNKSAHNLSNARIKDYLQSEEEHSVFSCEQQYLSAPQPMVKPELPSHETINYQLLNSSLENMFVDLNLKEAIAQNNLNAAITSDITTPQPE